MNDRTAAGLRREIVLARETPFQIARTQVRPPSLEVEFESQTTSLEPRVMQVLVALGRMGGRPVSREELIELCWAGRVVTDGALNRSIAQLRKALRDPGIQIETIPTVGYRLQVVAEIAPLVGRESTSAEAPLVSRAGAEISAASTVAAAGAANEQAAAAGDPTSVRGAAELAAARLLRPQSAKRLRVFGAVAAFLALGAAAWWFAVPGHSVIWSASEFRPLTSTADQETFPALSPDGTQIVYSIRPDAYSARDLYLRNVEEGTPVRLTSDAGDDFGAAWSPDGSRVAFFRATEDEPCALVVVPVPGGTERVVSPCRMSGESRPSWLDSRTLVFSDRSGSAAVPRIRSVDIESGAMRDLTTPASSTMGDSDPQVAPDGRHIAFRRTLAVGADDLFALNVASGQEHSVTGDGWKASGYVWSADSGSIFFSSNRGGDFGLWSVDLHPRDPPRRVALGLATVSFMRMSADRRNRLAVESTRGLNKLARLSERSQVEILTAGAGYDGDPAAGSRGSVVHVSNRSGSYEIWLLREGASPSRLTSIHGSYVLEPSWSIDESRVVFVAVKGLAAEVYSVARDGSGLRQLTDDGAPKRDPVFSASGDRLYYLAWLEGSWRLMELELESRNSRRVLPGNAGWVTLRSSPDGTIFGRQAGERFVRRIHPPTDAGSGMGDSPGMEASPDITDSDSWAIGKNGVYVRRGRRPDQSPSLWFFPWQGEGRKLAEVPLASGNIAIDPQGRVLLSQSTSAEVDLALVELQAQR